MTRDEPFHQRANHRAHWRVGGPVYDPDTGEKGLFQWPTSSIIPGLYEELPGREPWPFANTVHLGHFEIRG
jgi:hypothetical protein